MLGMVFGSSTGRMVLLGVGLFGLGYLKGYASVDVEGAVRGALASRDAEWAQKLEKANDEHEKELQSALQAGRSVVPVAPGRDALVRLCRDPKAGADCREKVGNRVPGVR